MLMRTRVLAAIVLGTFVWAAPAAAQTWDHVHLTVSDTAAAAEWYAKHFDGKVTKSGRFDAVLFGSNLVKFKAGDDVLGSQGSAVDHVAFSVEDVADKMDALREDGVEINYLSRRTKSVAQGTDPWGTTIELLDDEDLRGFHHVHLKTTRPSSTIEWYVTAFGGEPEKFKNVPSMTVIRYGDMYLLIQRSLQPVESTAGHTIDHIAWRVPDFQATFKRLKGMGVKFLLEPTKSGDHLIAFIEGPDGVKIEVVEDVGE